MATTQLVEWMEDMTRDAGAAQQNALAQILAQNAHTEYLKGFKLLDVETFKSKVPMVSYDDIRPFIQRIADGDRSPILCSQPISELLWSSGTSGEPKLIPFTKQVLDRNFHILRLSEAVMHKHVEGLDKGKRLFFMFTKPDKTTPGGIPVRLATSSTYKSDAFKHRSPNIDTSPNEAIYCEDTFQSIYTQLLTGLYSRHQVNRVETIFASSLVRVIKFLRLHWHQLTHDIRTGSLNPKVTDPPLRKHMTRLMKPDPSLSDQIVRECANDNWEGIVTRIWPNTKYLATIVTGTMAQYIPALDYYSGGLPIASMIYGSSECFFGINLDPMCKPSRISYTFIPNEVYFEFLSSEDDDDDDDSQPVGLVDVEIGKEYEVVVTTTAGLYRYRVGDIVRAVGFHNSSPRFEFVTRRSVVLNVEWEMTKEDELQVAVEKGSEYLVGRCEKTRVVDYTSVVDTSTSPDHYVIYWEVEKGKELVLEGWVMEGCCGVMEESMNWAYRRLRVTDGLIGPLEIRVVEEGTFEEVMDYAISKGVSMSQYKAPRCVGSKKGMFEILESRVVSKHFSKTLPHLSVEQKLFQE